MADKEEARQRIADLVARFQALGDAGRRRLTEAETKTAFIEPLFEALGWDVRDPAEVGQETQVSKGRADYAFRLDGTVRFFLEAKPPRADLSNPEYAQQAITYAFYQGVRWAVLTDFEELHLFNADWEGTPSRARFLYLRAPDYVPQFDRLWLLSRQNVIAGQLDGEAARVGATQPRIRLEEKLFAQLRGWREELFTQIRQHNPTLSLLQVDESIMRLFNRLIFIRNCEDRQLEERRLISLVRQRRRPGRHRELMVDLQALFREFDGYYDSDLFRPPHLIDGKGFLIEAPTLEKVIEGLYRRPGGLVEYDFEQLPADVLGAVYEQYLGYVTREAKRVLEIEQRKLPGFATDPTAYEVVKTPERRKAQGIYYTPAWVVDYIVRQTVGRYLAEHTPDEAFNMTILDPACGSGSFLIRAYEELLGYWAGIQGIDPRRNFDDRIPILRRNIFGVDLDDQAVQIAQLNLLLRALAKRDILPSLADNIRRGNSLISGGEEELRPYFGDAWREKHRFNWEQEFRNIMDRGGFDVVIGNPPYVRIQGLPEGERNYYRDHFDTASGSFDLYVLFVERAIELLKPGGYFGFITSGKFLKSTYGKKLCQHIYQNCTVEEIIDLSALQVFAEATTYPILLILRKGKEEKLLYYSLLRQEPAVGNPADGEERLASQDALLKGVWPPPSEGQPLMDKLFDKAVPLKEVAERIFVGLQTSADKIFILENMGKSNEHETIEVRSRQTGTRHELEAALLKPLLSGPNVHRYISPATSRWLLFPYHIQDGAATLITPEEFESLYPRAWAYLCENREALEGREGGKMRHERWYAFGRTQNLALHDRSKLAIPRLVHRLCAFYDSEGRFYLDNVDVGGLLLKVDDYHNYCYMVGLLNSSLLDFCHSQISAPFRGGYRSANRQFLEPLPIRRIDFDNAEEKALHDRLVALVERMLGLHRRKADKTLPHSEGEDIEREIARTDREIDTLVYDLYGLTEEERRLVEQT